MKKLIFLLKKLTERFPKKCYAHLYYPYTKIEICTCIDKCKYDPPNSAIENIYNEKLYTNFEKIA